MKRPEKWYQLPYVLRECILWNVELDYDSYESSQAETIHDLMNCEPVPEIEFNRNHKNAQNYYNGMSDKDLEDLARAEIEIARAVVNNLQKFVDNSGD